MKIKLIVGLVSTMLVVGSSSYYFYHDHQVKQEKVEQKRNKEIQAKKDKKIADEKKLKQKLKEEKDKKAQEEQLAKEKAQAEEIEKLKENLQELETQVEATNSNANDQQTVAPVQENNPVQYYEVPPSNKETHEDTSNDRGIEPSLNDLQPTIASPPQPDTPIDPPIPVAPQPENPNPPPNPEPPSYGYN